MLPPCFIPDERTTRILWRVDEGYDVSFEEAAPLVRAGLLSIFEGPTARSGYELTPDGEEALDRVMPKHD